MQMAKKSSKRKRTKKKPPATRHSVRNLSKGNWDIIERVWAADGLVHWQDKSGRTGWHTIKEAALRAHSINMMPYPAWQKPQVQKLVETIVEACREAQAQRSDPQKSKKTAAIINLVDRKMPDGSPMGDPDDEDKHIQALMFQFPTLDERDIRAILRDDRLDMPRKKSLMQEIHRQQIQAIDVKLQ
jgi:hypothetical protein